MAMNKKGIFFTLAAIALSIIILFSFKVYTNYELKDELEPIGIRVETMNNFIKDLEDDAENAIFIAGFRSLLSLEDYLMEWDQFFNELGAPTLNVAFSDAFLKGTIDEPAGSPQKMSIMEGNTFINWTERMKVLANKTGIEIEFNIDSVTISQSDPWTVDVTVQLDITVKDEKNTASWSINNKDFTIQINITTSPTKSPNQKKFVEDEILLH